LLRKVKEYETCLTKLFSVTSVHLGVTKSPETLSIMPVLLLCWL
jgi:hypothetical protein